MMNREQAAARAMRSRYMDDIGLTERQLELIEKMADEAVLGETVDEVVKYLLTRALDDLRRSGR